MNGRTGWHRVAAHERHWFRDGRSLCDEYGLAPGATYYLDQSDERTGDDCPECRRRLADLERFYPAPEKKPSNAEGAEDAEKH